MEYRQYGRMNVKRTCFSTPDHETILRNNINSVTKRPLSSKKSNSYSYLYSAMSPKSIKSTKSANVKVNNKNERNERNQRNEERDNKKKRKRDNKNNKKKDKKSRRHRRSNSSKSSTSSSQKSYSSSNKLNKLNMSAYDVLDTVGCGSFAKVSRVRRKSTKEILVWKELSYGIMSDKEKQMLCDEVNILRDLNHPNIVKFVDRIIDHQNRKIYIVQEYCDGGDLQSYIKLKKDKSGRISETFIWSVTSEIASALQHCHNHFNRHNTNKKDGKRRILHRDLKPGNVFLVKRRGSYSVKLGDFGLAKMLDESSIFAQTHVGTPYYMSPEQIQSKSYNEKSDIWSLGCIVYEMAMLSPPFKAANYLQLAEKIKLGIYKKVSLRNYSSELENAISIMLKVNSNKRSKVEELLCLPRIQFTSKILRLDRRYCQLKKKEYQFNLKMQLLEDKYKRKSLALLQKENELKLKENQLKQKEDLINLSSKTSSFTSNGSSKSSNLSGSNDSHSSGSNNSSNLNTQSTSPPYTPISPNICISHSFTKRAKSNHSNHTTSNSNTSLAEKKTESQPNSSDNSLNGDDDHDFEYFNKINTINQSVDSGVSMDLPVSLDRHSSNVSNISALSNINSDEDNNSNNNNNNVTVNDNSIMDDARNFLMKKINLNDLNGNNNNNNLYDHNYLKINNYNNINHKYIL